MGKEPDSLSDFQRASLAKVFGRFEIVRIDPIDNKEHDRICREQGDCPVLSMGLNNVAIGRDAMRRGVAHFIFYYSSDDEPELERLTYNDGVINFWPVLPDPAIR